MDDRAAQIFTGLSVLVLLWIGVYWLWEPSTPRVSHGGEPVSLVDTAPQPQEQTPEPAQQVRPGVTPPEFRTHTLKQGETFETIARDQYGDSSSWDVIARANPLKDPRRLKAGQTIRVPLDAGNVQGVVVRPPEPVAPDPEPTPTAQTPVSARTHTVQSGDTLSSIAQQHLGSSARAREVFELNRDQLRDMHSLSIGQTLRLP